MGFDLIGAVRVFAGWFMIWLGMLLLGRFYINTKERKNAAMLITVMLIPASFIVFQVLYQDTKSFLMAIGFVIIAIILLEQYSSVPKMLPEVKKLLRFEDRVKHDLGLEFVKIVRTEFPRKFNWVGGFMMPILPLFYVVNTASIWNVRRQEAMVHELMHIRIFLNGYLLFLLAVPLFAVGGIYLIAPGLVDSYFIQLILGLFVAAMLVLNEYMADTATRKYLAQNFPWIYSEPLAWSRYKKYMIIYGLYMISAVTLLNIGRWLF